MKWFRQIIKTAPWYKKLIQARDRVIDLSYIDQEAILINSYQLRSFEDHFEFEHAPWPS